MAALIASAMPQMLATADGEANDGVSTPAPAKIFTTAKADLEEYPAVEIIATDSAPQLDTNSQVMRHRLVVGFTIVGDDEDTLQTQVERYMWSLRRILRDAWTDCLVGVLDTGGEQFTPPLRRPPGLEAPFVTGGFIEVIAQTAE